jgi:hypothetical protein
MWETSLWARLIASASEPGNHHQGYRGYVAHNNVLRGYEFRSGDARREKQIEGQSMETSEKKRGCSAHETGMLPRHRRGQ